MSLLVLALVAASASEPHESRLIYPFVSCISQGQTSQPVRVRAERSVDWCRIASLSSLSLIFVFLTPSGFSLYSQRLSSFRQPSTLSAEEKQLRLRSSRCSRPVGECSSIPRQRRRQPSSNLQDREFDSPSVLRSRNRADDSLFGVPLDAGRGGDLQGQRPRAHGVAAQVSGSSFVSRSW